MVDVGRLLRRPIFRLVPVGIVFIALQRAVLADIPIRHVVLELVLALAAACGVAGGPERGAYAGFVLGVMFDLGTASPLGENALAFGLAAYVAGFVTLVAVDPHWWLSMIFAMAGAATGEVAIPVVETFIKDGGWQGHRVSVIVLIVSIFSGALSPLLIPLGRWCLCIRKRAWKVPTA